MAVTAAPLAKPKSNSKKKTPPKAPPIIQPKLDIGPVGDHFEREADSVARRVMSGGDTPVAIPPTITPLTAQRGAQSDAGHSAQGGAASASVESSVARMQAGSAGSLDSGTQNFMENRFGRDFGDLRIHGGGEAQSAAQSLGAKAFTVGNDVFFNRGQYRPESSSGRELIAHELTHTVQQAGINGVAARKLIQRNGDGDGSPVKLAIPDDGNMAFTISEDGREYSGSLNNTDRIINLPILRLPTLNGTLKGTTGGTTPGAEPKGAGDTVPTNGGSWSIQAIGSRPSGAAATKWKQYAERNWSSGLVTKLTDNNDSGDEPAQFEGGMHMLGFKDRGGTKDRYFVFGTLDEISKSPMVLIPSWSKDNSNPNGPPPTDRPTTGGENFFDADHILEWQLGGADEVDNMWLLKSDYNQQIGGRISGGINSDISSALQGVQQAYDVSSITLPGRSSVREGWQINFAETINAFNTTSVFWTRSEIQAGDQLAPLKLLSHEDIAERGFTPATDGAVPTELNVFPTDSGGKRTEFPIADGRIALEMWHPINSTMFFMDGFYNNDGTNLGAMRIAFFRNLRNDNGNIIYAGGSAEKRPVQREIHIPKVGPFSNVGKFSRQDVYAASESLHIDGFSPLMLSTFELDNDGNLHAGGLLQATKALFPNFRPTLSIFNDEIRLDAPLPIDAFNLGPVTVTQLSMGIGYGADGPSISGTAGFMIRGVGEGSITASASAEGPVLAGTFDVDADFFSESSIDVAYNFTDDSFLASGRLAVESGRIPGVESGTVTVTITRDNIDVDGTINLAGPLSGSTIRVGYTQEEGLTIGGTFPLPLSNLPAVENATMTLNAARNPDSGEWSLSGTGSANLAVPGVSSRLELAYADGIVTMTANAEIVRGPASGTLNFTATNGAIDEEGNPIEGEIGNDITAWGRGSVTIQFGNILQGTAGIEYTADNRVILSGGIALPPVYEVFARREFNRDLLHLEPPEFPIWGVSVAGVGVGIFAFVDANISFSSYVGPGEIRDAEITAEMDLDRPQDATIHGGGQFFVPAYAGLNLDLGGGLRARATVAYAQGRVGLEGRLGIEADASATVDIDWNRTDGLEIQADFEANARPKFQLLANASLTVGVDLLVTEASHTFGPWERNLGEFGPDMEMGVDFPVRWSEADGLDLSLDNMTIREPTLDASGLMGDVFDRLVA